MNFNLCAKIVGTIEKYNLYVYIIRYNIDFN